MENIFLIQHNGYLNGHYLIDKDGTIIENKDEYEILNFIFSNKIQDFHPLIIEYELSDDNTISEKTMKVLINSIKHFVHTFNLNPFLNVETIKSIFDCNITDYLFDNANVFKELKLSLVYKNYYLINNELKNIKSNEYNFTYPKISDDQMDKIKNDILNRLRK